MIDYVCFIILPPILGDGLQTPGQGYLGSHKETSQSPSQRLFYPSVDICTLNADGSSQAVDGAGFTLQVGSPYSLWNRKHTECMGLASFHKLCLNKPF